MALLSAEAALLRTASLGSRRAARRAETTPGFAEASLNAEAVLLRTASLGSRRAARRAETTSGLACALRSAEAGPLRTSSTGSLRATGSEPRVALWLEAVECGGKAPLYPPGDRSQRMSCL